MEGGALPTLRRCSGGCDATVVIIGTLQERVVAVKVFGYFVREERLMRRTVNSNVNRDIISPRDWSSERGGKSVPIELEVYFRLELTSGIRPGI